jgi:SAM-dependent methyltransferase
LLDLQTDRLTPVPDNQRGVDLDESAKEAYDQFAHVYDRATAQNDYELWLGATLLPELEKCGLRQGRALDVGCGTGRSFVPLLTRDWQVVGCDVSPEMISEAARKFQTLDVFEADARDLPLVDRYLGLPTEPKFDLILLLNDVVNYMIEDGDLERVFAGVKLNLGPEGLAIFDANTLALYGDAYRSQEMEERMGKGDLEWQGLTDEVQPGIVFEARLSGRGVRPHIHRQRHWTSEQINDALGASGLRVLAAFGQQEEGGQIRLVDPPDETRDPKIIYIAADQSRGFRGTGPEGSCSQGTGAPT